MKPDQTLPSNVEYNDSNYKTVQQFKSLRTIVRLTLIGIMWIVLSIWLTGCLDGYYGLEDSEIQPTEYTEGDDNGNQTNNEDDGDDDSENQMEEGDDESEGYVEEGDDPDHDCDGHEVGEVHEGDTTKTGCKILIDASHDGGIWWYPQSSTTGFDPNAYHQGKSFAETIRAKGFEVYELGRGIALTEEILSGYDLIVRIGGYQGYMLSELQAYEKVLKDSTRMMLFSDHKSYVQFDGLEDMLGLQLKGGVNGVIATYQEHPMTNNMAKMGYIAGCIVTNEDNPAINIIGRLREEDFWDQNNNGIKDAGEIGAPAVIGTVNYANQDIFFIGDSNGLLMQPEPFVTNMIDWLSMSSCH
ncbi:hypothetical protein [Marinoscillum sp. MHG1-6]|uniref:hypothetical protein n=1 Tax=Marinoscillum sp. MHG1-6 TaxID=2959627 RepID=UPI00215775D9|nr:hypothetical protein [Marinoscillum sp. MHG1-6]